MTNDQELATLWQQLTSTYQQLNACQGTAEHKRLTRLADMLRIEYRHLTSTYK